MKLRTFVITVLAAAALGTAGFMVWVIARSGRDDTLVQRESSVISLDWLPIALSPWWLPLLFLLLMLLLCLSAMLGGRRIGRLSLLARCFLASLVVHALLLLALTRWHVGVGVEQLVSPSGGSRIAVELVSRGDDLASQLHAGIIDLPPVATATPEHVAARMPDPGMPESASLPTLPSLSDSVLAALRPPIESFPSLDANPPLRVPIPSSTHVPNELATPAVTIPEPADEALPPPIAATTILDPSAVFALPEVRIPTTVASQLSQSVQAAEAMPPNAESVPRLPSLPAPASAIAAPAAARVHEPPLPLPALDEAAPTPTTSALPPPAAHLRPDPPLFESALPTPDAPLIAADALQLPASDSLRPSPPPLAPALPLRLPGAHLPTSVRGASPPLPSIPIVAVSFPRESLPAGGSYAQRAPTVRAVLVKQFGGSEETERAVALALDWLARHQAPDGRWSSSDFDGGCGVCGGTSNIRSDVALTGLALLCFLGADHTHTKDGPYRDTVARAVRWLLGRQNLRGDLRAGETMYSHGIATIALAEAYGMTGDAALRRPVQLASNFIVAAASPRTGGWRYEPQQDGDTSVLGWQVLALVSARRAGIDVPQRTLDDAGRWLDSVSWPHRPGVYSYQPGLPFTPSMTAEGLFVRQLLGRGPDDPAAAGSIALISEHLPEWGRNSNTYYWYYATLALFQHQGEPWERWNGALTAALVRSQRTIGPAAGSWDPRDKFSMVGGRVYQTALCTLCLEVYYRYLPMYASPAPTPPVAPSALR